jgi:hypothetical protein
VKLAACAAKCISPSLVTGWTAECPLTETGRLNCTSAAAACATLTELSP